ncbi:hypothetical protein J2X02_000932 [Pseudoxanthomonas japonensis]|nr:hypothetical protein [Pseudoxanthomonas japonensis]MDR7068115.1 hypothetical protein [Pseudoxanthomonas japonensis]
MNTQPHQQQTPRDAGQQPGKQTGQPQTQQPGKRDPAKKKPDQDGEEE